MKFSTQREIQERLLNRVLLILGIITIPALFFSILRYINIGWSYVYIVNTAMGLIVIFLSLFRNYVSYNLKVTLLIAVFSGLAIGGALHIGLSSFFIQYLMLSILTGVIFAGRKKAFYIYLGGAVLIIITGILNVKGIISPAADMNRYPGYATTWINALYSFLTITGLVILVTGEIGYYLTEKISKLEKINRELQNAMSEIKTLQGILPICARCKMIRDSNGYWMQVEKYIQDHSELKFSHGLCEKCADELYGNEDWYKEK